MEALSEARIHQLRQIIAQSLPGWSAQQRMSTVVHRDARLKPRADARRAAVLMLLYPREDQVYLPLIVRPIYDGVHSGQIALPGGKVEKEDRSLVHTALRETKEEIGVDVAEGQVLGVLSELYIPPSNMLVTPVLAYTQVPSNYTLELTEVAEMLDFPLSDFQQSSNQTTVLVEVANGRSLEAPCFLIEERVIWGATAMMMSELVAIVNQIPRG